MNIKEIHKFYSDSLDATALYVMSGNWLFYEDETRDAAIVKISILARFISIRFCFFDEEQEAI